MKYLFAAAGAFLAASLPVAAQAAQTVITFQGLQFVGQGKAVTSYSEGGYLITAATGSLTSQQYVGALPDGIPSVTVNKNAAFSLSAVSGDTFTFDGFDGFFSGSSSTFRPLSFTGFLAGIQTFSATVGAPNTFFTSFDSGSGPSIFDRIDFTTAAQASALYLDNIRVTAAVLPPVVIPPVVIPPVITPSVDAVPEPASWAMMIGGFGMIGTALRHRPRTRVRFA